MSVLYILCDAFHSAPTNEVAVDFTNLVVGHRWLGATNGKRFKKNVVIKNALNSFETTVHHGSAYIEFDVQLSSDSITVVCDDFFAEVKILTADQKTLLIGVPVNKLTNLQQRNMVTKSSTRRLSTIVGRLGADQARIRL